jgi:Family of unknown function (DUF5691)
MWQQLINTALLGTDKINFDDKSLPESIQEIIKQIPEHDKEALFLKTAALVAFYQEAGQIPKRFEGEFTTLYQVDIQTIASLKFLSILDEIVMIEGQFRNHLLEIWLDKLIEKKQVCTAKKTIILLSLSDNLPKKFHSKIPKVLNQKGLDLWVFKTGLVSEEEKSEEEIWEEGKLVERRELFGNLRKNNPQKAIDLLIKTWKEESLNDKMAFVEVIQNTFEKDDVIFLTEILPEFSFKEKERKTQREIRKTIMVLLLNVPQNEIYLQVTEALKKYVVQEKAKGVLGWVGKENKVVRLPKEEDDFMNSKNMEAIYGLEKSPDFAIFTTNQLYWFSHFLEFLPFSFWMNSLEKDMVATVNYFLSEEFLVKLSGKKTAVLLTSMIQNAVNQDNMELAKTLIAVTNLNDQIPLLRLLSIPEREQYMISTKQLNSLPVLEACFLNWNGVWSAEFSSKILKECYATIIEKNRFLNEKFALIMSEHLHHSSDNFLNNAKVYPVSAMPYYINYWEKNFVDALESSMKIKQKCKDIL